MGNYSKAKAAFDIYMHSGNATVADYSRYALLLYLNKDYDRSLAMVEKGLASDSSNRSLMRVKMYDLCEMKSYDAGIQAAADLFREVPADELVYLDYVYRARLYANLGDFEKSKEDFQSAIAADKANEHPEVLKEASEMCENNMKYDDAIRLYEEYMDILGNKTAVSDVFLWGRLHYKAAAVDSIAADVKEGYLKKADEVFADVATRVPDNYLGYFWRARTNAMLDPETTQGLAKPYYETAMDILKANPKAQKSLIIECMSYLGYYYFLKEEYDTSKEYWNSILQLDPSNVTARQALEGIK